MALKMNKFGLLGAPPKRGKTLASHELVKDFLKKEVRGGDIFLGRMMLLCRMYVLLIKEAISSVEMTHRS